MNVLITGSTGMVGKSVLIECIKDERVKKIFLLNRVSSKIESSKISEFLLKDFLNLKALKIIHITGGFAPNRVYLWTPL